MMSAGTPPSAVVLPACPNRSGLRDPGPVGGTAVPGATHRRRLRWLLSALGETGGILSTAFVLPVVILAIGIPIALGVRLLAWLAGAL